VSGAELGFRAASVVALHKDPPTGLKQLLFLLKNVEDGNCPSPGLLQTKSDILRIQTRRVSQTIVFRYSEIGGRLYKKHRKNSVVPT
jgi:hypothetical protein